MVNKWLPDHCHPAVLSPTCHGGLQLACHDQGLQGLRDRVADLAKVERQKENDYSEPRGLEQNSLDNSTMPGSPTSSAPVSRYLARQSTPKGDLEMMGLEESGVWTAGSGNDTTKGSK